MNIIVFSNNKNIMDVFSSIKGKKYTLEYYGIDDLKKEIKKADEHSFVYLDISSFSMAELPKAINFLAKNDAIRFGIIDSKNIAKDSAQLFHKGAVDYVGKDIYKGGISAKRIDSVLNFKPFSVVEKDLEEVDNFNNSYILSGKDWKDIKSGHEYTFCFLFIELDKKNEFKKRDPQVVKKSIKQFHDYLEGVFAPYNGKIWMWMDFGGLILLPFDGQHCGAIYESFRLMLNRKIVGFEEMGLDISLSLRMAMHIGNTVYKKRGDTGKIISDSINSIFHLGQKFAPEDSFCLTEEVFRFTPGALTKFFVSQGEYEGRKIMKMMVPQ